MVSSGETAVDCDVVAVNVVTVNPGAGGQLRVVDEDQQGSGRNQFFWHICVSS